MSKATRRMRAYLESSCRPGPPRFDCKKSAAGGSSPCSIFSPITHVRRDARADRADFSAHARPRTNPQVRGDILDIWIKSEPKGPNYVAKEKRKKKEVKRGGTGKAGSSLSRRRAWFVTRHWGHQGQAKMMGQKRQRSAVCNPFLCGATVVRLSLRRSRNVGGLLPPSATSTVPCPKLVSTANA